MSILIIGGTGTLGRQIVKQTLEEGYEVKCLVRDFRRAAFLKDWGADLVYGDLSIPSTLPKALKGIQTIIDSSTIRSTSSYTSEIIDWRGKLALIEAAKLIGIKKFISFSIVNANENSSIPLMDLKVQIDKKIEASGLNYTIFKCSGFFQGLISQYALPILENETLWLQKNDLPTAYLDTQDAAKIVVDCLSNLSYEKQSIALIGKKFWTAAEIVELCERLSGKTAKITYIPGIVFWFLRRFLRWFEFTWNVADRLQFGEMQASGNGSQTSIIEVNWPCERLSLESYLQEYFGRILKKLRETNYQQSQKANEISFL